MFFKIFIILTIIAAALSRHPMIYQNGIRTNYTTPYVDNCYMRRCTSNEHCCARSICLSLDLNIGYCFYYRGINFGAKCKVDRDCDYNLICRRSDHFEYGKCRESDHDKLHYGQACNGTSECNFRNGLCCMEQKRPRQKPRNICSYYADPLRCIDIVPMESRRQDENSLTVAEQRTVGEELRDLI